MLSIATSSFGSALARALGLLLPLALAFPARAEVVPLAELERRAVAQRTSVAAARARTAQARSAVELAEAPLHPTLNARVTGDVAPGNRLVRVTDDSGEEYLMTGSRAIGDSGALLPELSYGAGLSLGARLYDFGRTRAAVRARRVEHRAADLGERVEERAVVSEVRAAYLTWLSAYVARDIHARAVNVARSLRKAMEARIAEGSRSGASGQPARSSEASLELELERAHFALEASLLELERAVGAELSPRAEPDLTLLDASAGGAPAAPVLEQAVVERRREALGASAEAIRGSKLPVLSAGVDLGVRGQGPTVFPVYRVGVAVSIPLLDGGARSSSDALALARSQELLELAGEARADAALERAKARAWLARSDARLALGRRLVAVADEAVRHAEDRAKLGDGDSEPLRQAALQRTHAELELLAIRVERARAVLSLREGAASVEHPPPPLHRPATRGL